MHNKETLLFNPIYFNTIQQIRWSICPVNLSTSEKYTRAPNILDKFAAAIKLIAGIITTSFFLRFIALSANKIAEVPLLLLSYTCILHI